MKRVIEVELGINTLKIHKEYNFTQLDKNLQSIYCKFDNEVDIENYDLLVKYKLPNNSIIADTYKLKKELDIIVPTQALSQNGILNIEFCYISKDKQDTITINKNMSVYIKKTLEVNTNIEDVVLGDNIATLLNRITTSVNKGIENIEKHTREQINSINLRYKSIQKSLQEKEINAIENISNTTTQKITSLENKTKACIEEIYQNKEKFRGPQGPKGDPGEKGVQGEQGEKGDPGVVDYTGLATDTVDRGQFNSIKDIIDKGFYGNIRFRSSSEIQGLPDVRIFYGNMFVSRTNNVDTAIFLLAPNHTSKNLYFLTINSYQAEDIENTKNKWVKIWHSGNLDLQNLQPLTIESSVGNHIVLKRSGELKGSLTSNQDGIALYNEKSGKMFELKDSGSVVIPAKNLNSYNKDVIESLNKNNGQWLTTESIEDLDSIKFNGWVTASSETKNNPCGTYAMVNNILENGLVWKKQHQFCLKTLESGIIYHRLVGQDWVRMANVDDINELKNEIKELRAEIQKLKGE